MKILYVIPSLEVGGAEIMLMKMTIELKNRGHKCVVLTFTAVENYITQALKTNGIKLISSNCSKNYSLRNPLFLYTHLSKNQYDIVHAHLTTAQLWTGLVNSLGKWKHTLITTEHCSFNRRRKSKMLKLVDQFIYSHFKAIICVSKDTQKELINWVPNCKNKCHLIYNGINLNEFQQEKNTDNSKTIKLISVARLTYQKNPEVLITAISHLPENFHLILVGGGDSEQALKEQAKQLGVSHQVHFLGRRNDIPDLLNQADIYVQASRFEGFSLSSIEAMAAELPVVVTDIGVHREVLGDSALFYPIGDVDELVSIIKNLGDKPSLRKEMISKSRKRALQFSFENTVLKHISLYQKCNKINPSLQGCPIKISEPWQD